MSFDWPRMYKHEENVELDIIDRVHDHVCEHYNISSAEDMTREQFQEVEKFYNTMNEYSVMKCGFADVLNCWEREHGA